MLAQHDITDEAMLYIKTELEANRHWIAYNSIYHCLDKTNVFAFENRADAKQFSADNISDDDNYSVVWVDSIADIIERQQLHHSNKRNVMNEKNFDYLKGQLKGLGFGEGHTEELKTKLQSGEKEFVIGHTADYGKDNTVATLQFRKSNNSDMYFFNSYNLHLKNQQHPEPIKQTFYTDDRFTLKEGYNMLAGRAVLNEKENKEHQKYTAWFQLDFKQNEKNGNYKMQPYYEKYGFKLDEALAKHPIKELTDPVKREYLMKALERGNLQQVTMEINGTEKKLFIEAAPQFKSINFYDDKGQRLKADQAYENKAMRQQGQTVKEQAKQLEGQSAKQGAKKENQQQNPGENEEGKVGKQQQNRSRRNKQKIS